MDYQTVKEKLKTSSYNGKLTIGQYFSFLKTQQVAKQNPDMRQDEDYKNFEKNFGNIQKEIPFVAKNNIEFPAETPVPAEDLQNLTAEQSEQIIENTEGMEEAVGTVEDVDYANPENIEMDDNDPVETKIYQATQQLANEPHHKLELAMIGRNDPNLNKDTALALHDIHEKIQEKGFFEDFPADDQDYFSQPPEQQKKMRKTLNPTQLKEFNALLKERNQIYSQMNTTAHLTAKDVTNAEKMIAKKGQEIAQKTAVGQFMKTVAGSLVNRVGDTNM